jgi:hypothetical protein
MMADWACDSAASAPRLRVDSRRSAAKGVTGGNCFAAALMAAPVSCPPAGPLTPSGPASRSRRSFPAGRATAMKAVWK